MVYYFGKTKTEGKGKSKALLGGKGLNLAEMTSIGLPVPPGFTITTEVCDAYYKAGKKAARWLDGRGQQGGQDAGEGTRQEVRRRRESAAGFVRSGAAVCMPGHDEHDSEPGPERRVDRWVWPTRPATNVSPTTPTAA